MTLPTCPVHQTSHPPVLCRTELVWHPVVCVPKAKEKVEEVTGTHGGVMGLKKGRLDDAARERRRIKNARRLSRRT